MYPSPAAVDARVLQMRWQYAAVPTQRHATSPEKVIVYKKRMRVFWRHIDQRLQAVTGLDDVMRIDIHQFCRYARDYNPRLNDCAFLQGLAQVPSLDFNGRSL